MRGMAGSFPFGLTARGATLFFFTTDATGQTSLWRSDGSDFGTERVTALPPGVFTHSIQVGAVAAGELRLLRCGRRRGGFPALSSFGEIGWGMEDGDVLLIGDFAGDSPGVLSARFLYPSVLPTLVALDDRVVFIANDGVHGREIWVSDGTGAVTSMLRDLAPGAEGGPHLPHALRRPVRVLPGHRFRARHPALANRRHVRGHVARG